MRQILIGAWLVSASTAVAACNGEAFAPNEPSSANDGSLGSGNSTSKGGSAGRSGAGTTSTSNHGGNSSSGGKASNGGGGAVVPPGTAGSAPGGGGTGSGGDSSGIDSACADGKVTFRMVPGPDLPEEYLCDASCGTGWLTITDEQGASALSIFAACGTASCESCEMLPCAAAACLPMPLTGEGAELSWTGNYLKQDTCGANMACQRQTCVAPGKYKAKACAQVNAGANEQAGGCMPKDGVMLCTEAEFDFPSHSEIELVLKKP